MNKASAASRSTEPGSLPVEPDEGPVPVRLPDEAEAEGTEIVCPPARPGHPQQAGSNTL